MGFKYETFYWATLYNAYRTMFPWHWHDTIPHSP